MGHPRGVFLAAGTEFWERFSFYALVGLLVLFLTGDVRAGGFGWSQQQAVLFYGFYSGLGFVVPALGGWLASNWLGERRAILHGGVTLALGQLFLASPGWLPWLIGHATGRPTGAELTQLSVPLGGLWLTAPVREATTAIAASPADLPELQTAYLCVGWGFALGLCLIIVGTGLLKPAVSSLVHKLYPGGGPRREQGFAIFMTFVYMGSVTASLIAGTLGENLGWAWGFAAAGVGMSFGISAYALLAPRWLGDVGQVPDRQAAPDAAPLDRMARDRIKVLLVMGIFTVIYATAFYQKGGLLNLFVKNDIDRAVGGFAIPATWFQTISTALFILLAHPLNLRLDRLRRFRPDAAVKLAAALLLIALGYVFFAIASLQASGGVKAGFGWIVAGYGCFGLGDVFLWPAQIALASRLAPRRHAATVVGCWYLTIGIGSWLTGPVAGQIAVIGRTALFVEIPAYCCVAAAALLCLRPWLNARMDEPAPLTIGRPDRAPETIGLPSPGN